MTWYLAVFLRVIVTDSIALIIRKKIASSLSRTRKLSLQFFICFILSLAFMAIQTNTYSSHFTNLLFLVTSLGLINSYACYCQWRATDLNVTKTSLFTQGDDVLSMVLAYIVLNERSLINLQWGMGIVLVLIAAVLFAVRPVAVSIETENRDPGNIKDKNKYNDESIWKWVIGYNLGWGIVSFMFRWLGLKGLPLHYFLPVWYGSSFIGSLFILFFGTKKEIQAKLTLKDAYPVLLLSLAVWLGLGFTYQAFSLAEVLKIRPLFQMGQVVVPLLIGLFLFKEIKRLTAQGKMAMGVGLVGVMLIFANS